MIRINTFLYSLVIISAIIFYSFSIVQGNSLEQAVLETVLNPDGTAYEVNVGVDGVIWVSDNLAGEIRGYQPDGRSAKIFTGLGSVSDARATVDGIVWFVDQDKNQLVRLDPLSTSTTSWDIPGTGTVFGTNVDNLGNIWVTKFNDSTIFRLTPGVGNEASLCEVNLTTTGYYGSDYIVDASGNLWVKGNTNQIIYIQPNHSDVDVTTFSVSDPGAWVFDVEGLSVDGEGGLWFADTSSGRSLVRLVPSPEPVFNRFPLPSAAGTPYMIAKSNNQIWYSGYGTSVIGKLDPNLVSPTSFEGTSNLVEDIPMICNPVIGLEKAISSDSFTPEWIPATYPITELSGWMITNLGSDSYPWGIAVQDDIVWSVDQGRQVLIRVGGDFDNNSYIFLPLVIK
jgi:streptogramin lyase